jgi:SNF2 family DNA or RNA helicase
MQSEDRNHRRGQHNSVSYDDLVINVEADKKITKAIARKHDVAMEFKEGKTIGELIE